MSRKQILTLYGLGAVCLVLAFATGFMANDLLGIRSGDFPVLMEAYEIIRTHGYDDLPDSPSMEYGMIRGMIQAYGDPYTSFVEPAAHEIESNNLHGSFGGIGARLERTTDGKLLVYPFPDSPAESAGVLDGDELIRVEDLDIDSDMPLEQVTAEIRGPEGEAVRIVVRRPGSTGFLTFEIQRENFPLPSVAWHISSLDPRVGVLDINLLAASTEEEIIAAAKELEAGGASVLILDLRDNSGGLLDAAVDSARLFLREGIVIEQQFKGEGVKTYRVEQPGPLAEIPIAVLINQNTVSAAEILAGALQSADRAELVGHSSFGKDKIQLVFNLSDGSSIHVSSARWWLPNAERSVSEGGLQPDFFVEPSDSDVDLGMQRAVELLLDSQ